MEKYEEVQWQWDLMADYTLMVEKINKWFFDRMKQFRTSDKQPYPHDSVLGDYIIEKFS